jgi:hypothetical protein
MSDNLTIAELREQLKNIRFIPKFPGKADHVRWLKSKLKAAKLSQAIQPEGTK